MAVMTDHIERMQYYHQQSDWPGLKVTPDVGGSPDSTDF
jgi:hypothetical protein